MKVTFHILVNTVEAPNGSQFVICHMGFDSKMEDFRRKTYLVMRSNIMQIPEVIT